MSLKLKLSQVKVTFTLKIQLKILSQNADKIQSTFQELEIQFKLNYLKSLVKALIKPSLLLPVDTLQLDFQYSITI